MMQEHIFEHIGYRLNHAPEDLAAEGSRYVKGLDVTKTMP